MDVSVSFLDEFVEIISEEEANLKDTYKEYEAIIEEINEKIDLHTIHKNIASIEMNSNSGAKEIFRISFETLRELENKKKSVSKFLRETKTHLNNEKKQIGEEQGMDTLLYEIVNKSKIMTQTFH